MPKKPTYEELENKVKKLENEVVEFNNAGDALRQNLEMHQTVVGNIDLGLTVIGTDYKIQWISPTVSKWFDKDPSEFVGKYCYQMFERKNGVCDYCPAVKAITTGQPNEAETQGIRPDGTTFAVRDKVFPILKDGKVIAFNEIVEDITERKQAEDTFRKERQFATSLIDNAPTFSVAIDAQGRTMMMNPRLLEALGYEAEEVVGKDYLSTFIPESERDELADIFRELAAEHEHTFNENLILTKDGREFLVEWHGTPVFDTRGDFKYFYGIGINITDRKRAEEALRESEDKYKSLTNNLNVGVFRNTAGPKGKFLEVNPAIVKMFGFDSREEFLKLSVSDLYKNPDDRKGYVAKLLREDALRNEELQLQKKNGSSFIGSVSAVLVKDEKKEVKYFDGIIEDITKRKRVEEALRESEEKHRHLFETAMIGIYRTQIEDGKFLVANKTMANMLGYESVDKLVEEYVTSKHYTDPKLRKELLNQLQSQKRVDGFEIEMTRTDGSTLQIALSAIAYPDRGYLEGFIVDITKRKQAEAALRESKEKLARSKKMESLGLLAGGVAHDLNNVLSGIVSYPELILLDLPEDSKFRGPIETIKESGYRAVAIVQDLLTVARGVAITREPLNLNDLVGDYLHSPEFNNLQQFHPIVTVKTNFEMELLNTSGSHVHIRKVLMNLVSNAAEAIEGSGIITISTMNRYLDRPLRGYDDMKIGEYIVLSVSDDGSGISSDDMERIFEPFYTKKFMGRSGTGLGLAVVWNIMLDHKGYIDVKSNENGTTFELYLPITRDELLGKGLSLGMDDLKGDGETILVVDDIETQREISCKMLDTLGYKTKPVSSGGEAVEYMKENTVDLVLLDMIMDPGINGRETYEKIIKIHPNQKAIIVSGFAETDDVREAQKLGAGQYIKKPVTLEKVGIAIKEELGKQ